MKENWIDIEGYEGLYQVSDHGRIRSIDRKVKHSKGGEYMRLGKIMKVSDTEKYSYVSLCKDGKSKTKLVHRLVAEAFIANTDNKPQVNHKNGIKSDNMAINLEWVTSSENQKHAFKNGLQKPQNGIKNPMSKLKREDLCKIVEMRGMGMTYDEIGRHFNVTYTAIKLVLKRMRWKHVVLEIPDSVKNYKHGNKGSNNHASKLTESNIPEIFKLRKSGMSYERIGVKFGVSKPTIMAIFKGETWKHVSNDLLQ